MSCCHPETFIIVQAYFFELTLLTVITHNSYSNMSKLSVGKKKAPEWNDVEMTDDNKAKCKHCSLVISSKVERIRLHLPKCSKFNAKDDNSSEPEEKRQNLRIVLRRLHVRNSRRLKDL